MPTRFHYAQVKSDSFALTPAEILLSTDAELNSYVGLRKYAPYRDKKQSSWDTQRNSKLDDLRKGLQGRRWGSTVYGEGSQRRAGDDRDGAKPKKRMGKKERTKLKAAQAAEGGEGEPAENGSHGDDAETESPAKPSRKRRSDDGDEEEEKKDNAVADGPSKKKRRRHRRAAATDQAS